MNIPQDVITYNIMPWVEAINIYESSKYLDNIELLLIKFFPTELRESFTIGKSHKDYIKSCIINIEFIESKKDYHKSIDGFGTFDMRFAFLKNLVVKAAISLDCSNLIPPELQSLAKYLKNRKITPNGAICPQEYKGYWFVPTPNPSYDCGYPFNINNIKIKKNKDLLEPFDQYQHDYLRVFEMFQFDYKRVKYRVQNGRYPNLKQLIK